MTAPGRTPDEPRVCPRTNRSTRSARSPARGPRTSSTALVPAGSPASQLPWCGLHQRGFFLASFLASARRSSDRDPSFADEGFAFWPFPEFCLPESCLPESCLPESCLNNSGLDGEDLRLLCSASFARPRVSAGRGRSREGTDFTVGFSREPLDFPPSRPPSRPPSFALVSRLSLP